MIICENICENDTETNVLLAKRISPRSLPEPQTLQQKQGLRYERKVVKALQALGLDVEHNPWFEYWGGVCCPDIVVYQLALNRAIVVEVKLTYTPVALVKLQTIYSTVVALVTGLKIYSLIITKNLVSFNDLYFSGDIESAIKLNPPVLQWLGRAPILLGMYNGR